MKRSLESSPGPAGKVALLHSGLTPAQLRRAKEHLTSVGSVVEVSRPTRAEAAVERLCGGAYSTVVLEETVASRPALEVLLHLRGHPATRLLPVFVLAARPSPFTARAYFNAGADCLVDTSDDQEWEKLARRIEPRAETSWPRFTERARRVVFFSQEEAARCGVLLVRTEHLLLGLLREEDSLAGRLLTGLGIGIGSLRETVSARLERKKPGSGGDTQLTPLAKRSVDLAEDESRQLGDNYIGTEHLLLGLLRETEGIAARMLCEAGVTADAIRKALDKMRA